MARRRASKRWARRSGAGVMRRFAFGAGSGGGGGEGPQSARMRGALRSLRASGSRGGQSLKRTRHVCGRVGSNPGKSGRAAPAAHAGFARASAGRRPALQPAESGVTGSRRGGREAWSGWLRCISAASMKMSLRTMVSTSAMALAISRWRDGHSNVSRASAGMAPTMSDTRTNMERTRVQMLAILAGSVIDMGAPVYGRAGAVGLI